MATICASTFRQGICAGGPPGRTMTGFPRKEIVSDNGNEAKKILRTISTFGRIPSSTKFAESVCCFYVISKALISYASHGA